jgi:hypothetical protein
VSSSRHRGAMNKKGVRDRGDPNTSIFICDADLLYARRQQ